MTSTSKSTALQQFFKTLSILHLAFCVAIFGFSSITLFLIESYSIISIKDLDIMYYALPIVAIVIVYGSIGVYKNSLKSIQPNTSLNQKLSHYNTANIVRYAMIEGPAFLCITVSLITNQFLFIIIAWCTLFYLYTIRPTKDVVIRELGLNLEERTLLKKA